MSATDAERPTVTAADLDSGLPDAMGLARLLSYGTELTRRRLAAMLLQADDREPIAMLVETVRSRDPWLLRARSLEILGLIVANAEREQAESILAALFDDDAD